MNFSCATTTSDCFTCLFVFFTTLDKLSLFIYFTINLLLVLCAVHRLCQYLTSLLYCIYVSFWSKLILLFSTFIYIFTSLLHSLFANLLVRICVISASNLYILDSLFTSSIAWSPRDFLLFIDTSGNNNLFVGSSNSFRCPLVLVFLITFY